MDKSKSMKKVRGRLHRQPADELLRRPSGQGKRQDRGRVRRQQDHRSPVQDRQAH